MKIRIRPNGLIITEEEYPPVEVDLADYPELRGLDHLEACEALSEQVVLNTDEKGNWRGPEGLLKTLYEQIQAQTPLKREITSKSLEMAIEEEEPKTP